MRNNTIAQARAAGYNGCVPEHNLGVALIGCGGMATHYRAVYAQHPGVELRLVVDADASVAQSVALELGVARFSTDWREALTNDIALADISTPNHLHEEQAVALLDARKHVILQKPLAPSLAACHRIVDAAQRAQTVAGVYMSDLEDPAVWELRELIRGGYLGRITGVRARYAHRGGLSAPKGTTNWRGSAEKTGGGSFIQLALHQTNLASWLLGEPIHAVMGLAKNLMCANIGGDDTAACIAEFPSGTIGVFESAWNANGSAFQLYGSEGNVTILGCEGARIEGTLARPFTGNVFQSDAQGRITRPEIPSAVLRGPAGPCNQHAAFLEAVKAGSPPSVSVETGRYDVAVSKAVLRSAEERRQVTIQELLEED